MNQLLRIHAIWNPHVYHGWGRSKRFFEGWYYKIVNESQTSAFAIIPGIAMDENGNKQSFIQVLDGINNIAKYHKFKADEYSFPSLISSEKLNKVGYYDNFPQSCCFAGHIKEDYDIINGFKIDNKKSLNNKISVKASLSPTVCHHLYFLLENKTITNNLVVTARSNCFRYETKNMDSLERTWNFNMREIILIGDQNFVIKKLSEIQKLIIKLLDKIRISYLIESANDPFFEGNYNDLISYQNAFKLKYEVRADTPYNQSSIAIGSFNNSQNLFGKKLNIKLKKEYVNSACVGFGFERFAYCFVSQHGLNINKWPNIVKNNLK